MQGKEKVYVQMPRGLNVWVSEEALRQYRDDRRRVTNSMVVEEAIRRYLDDCPENEMDDMEKSPRSDDMVMRGYYITQDTMMRVRERKVAEERMGRRSSIRSIIGAALRYVSR